MDIELTLEQFKELMKDIRVTSSGETNKKCPVCGNNVVIEEKGASGIVACKTKGCFSIVYRGI